MFEYNCPFYRILFMAVPLNSFPEYEQFYFKLCSLKGANEYKMKKQIVSFIVTLCMALTVICTTVMAETDYEEARSIIQKDAQNITVSNNTTEASLTADVQRLIPEGNPCTVIVQIVTKINATTEKKGSITAKIYLHDPTYNYTNSGETIIYYIPVATQNAGEVNAIDENVKAAENAFKDYFSSVTVTKDNILSQKKELLNAVQKTISNGAEAKWLNSPMFSTGMPKDGKKGYIRGTLQIVLGAETRNVELDAIINEDGSVAINNGENTENSPSVPASPETSSGAVTPSIPEKGTAHPSTQVVEIDGNKVTFEMYALWDANGNPTNYIKARDLAFALNDTSAPFDVNWNGVVNLLSDTSYTPNGTENNTPFSGDREYTIPQTPTNVNGVKSDLIAIFLTDDNGGGYTYYQLRDLGKKLGFEVGWSEERGIFVETE